MKNLQLTGSAVSLCGALALLAGCFSATGGALPRGSAIFAGARGIPDVRGKVTLYDDTFGDPALAGITKGPDGALWFTDPGNDVIGRITAHGKFTMEMPVGAEVSDGITVGPDGALWFTIQQSAAQIGRITTGGTVTLFNDGGGSFPQGITTGPDGALWFAESNGRVGRMTTSGHVRHYDVAPANAMLEGIATGPDGALWVTQYVVGGSRFSNQVIRVTTSGKKKSYTVGFGPAFICVGTDGALWFAESGAGAIGRLTTSGSFSEFPIGDPRADPFGIAAGPDGAIWFADFGRGGIGRVTMAGRMKFYAVPGSVPEVEQIVPGPGRAMWFTVNLAPNAIGRITTH